MDGPSGLEGLRWFVVNPDAVARIAEEALRDDAWWIAARSGQYFQGPTVWADCVRRRVVIPRFVGVDDGDAINRVDADR